MPRASPVRARLVGYVKALWEEHRQADLPVLPSIRHMAGECGVSYETMWKAVNECRNDGLLRIAAGGRIRLTVPGDTARPTGQQEAVCVAPNLSPKWQRVRDRIRAELIRGTYQRGRRLPPYKVLSSQYGAGNRVLRTALAALGEEGFLEECPGGLCPRAPTRDSAQDTIVLLTGALRGGSGFGQDFGRNWDVVRALERECAAMGCRLIRADPRSVSPSAVSELPAVRSAFGTVLWTTGIAHDYRVGIVHALSSTGKPLAVLDEAAQTPYSDAQHALSLIQLFSLGCKPSAGDRVARHLLSLGHRHVAYFSSLSNEARLEGLRRTFTRAGEDNTVEVYRKAVDGAEGNWVEEGRAVRVDVPQGSGLPPDAGQRLARALNPRLSAAVLCETVRMRFTPLFGQALADPRVTAWVGCSDIIAGEAQQFLEQRSISVPESMSVVGFDDSTEAALGELSSYNFNVSGLASAILTHLLFPRPRRERRGMGEWYEPTGAVTVRASSARPRRH